LSVQPTGAPSRRTTRQGAGAQAGRRASRARTAPADVRQPAWLNTPLGLVRLRLDRCDDPGRWVVLIRDHLDRNGGRPGYPHRVEDPTIVDPGTGKHQRRSSLRRRATKQL